MAYDFSKRWVYLNSVTGTGTVAGNTLPLNATGRKSRFICTTNTIVHAVGMVAVGSAAKGGTLTWKFRATGGSSVTAGTALAITSFASGTTSGKITARRALRSLVCGGGVFGCYVSTAATGVLSQPMALIEEQPFDPLNNTKITLVTT